MIIRRARPVVAVCAALAALMATTGAHAASFGGLTALSLGTLDAAASDLAPAIISCDDFGRPASTGSALAARPVQLPASCGSFNWTTHLGTWTISSGQLATTTTNASATIAAGQTDISAEATILNANGSSRSAGVAINHSGVSRIYLVAALVGPGTVRLRLVNGSTITSLASATATITATTVVRITRVGSAVKVSVNGALRISYTLTNAQVTMLGGGTRVGLYWNSGSTIRFKSILATQPSSP